MREADRKYRESDRKYTGLAISDGVTCGRICLFNDGRHNAVPRYEVSREEVPKELSRFREALEQVGQDLDAITEQVSQRVGEAEAGIFNAQRMILHDPDVVGAIEKRIRDERQNVAAAVADVLDQYEARIHSVDNTYIQEWATDIGELKRRLIGTIHDLAAPGFQCAENPHCQKGRHRIIVAEELTPLLTSLLDAGQTLAFVTERGGRGSHAAILAQALGIPAVSNLQGIRGEVGCGMEVLVDGDNGEVIVNPSEATKRAYDLETGARPAEFAVLDPVPSFRAMANISRIEDVKDALEAKAEGIGLYRTEFEVLAAGRILTEDEMFERYVEVVQLLAPAPVYFRLFDIGGDKEAPFLSLPQENNPYLGFRGSRLLLGRPDLMRPQARALARVSRHGTVHVMYPMVIDAAQFARLVESFEDATEDIETGDIRHGAMFEVPSACLEANEILRQADFGSIGTNDLIQYLFAVDRNNALVATDYDPGRPALWAMIGKVAAAARINGKPLSLCGQMASMPEFLGRLVELGITTLSVSARQIGPLRASAPQESTLLDSRCAG